jgi:cytidylate kinase
MAILTISRQFGCGAEEIGASIARELGYEYLDRQMILDDMKKAGGKWEEKAKYFDENTPDLWERHEWSFRGYVALTQCNIYSHALKNNYVIIGRGANFLLKGVKHHLGIRIEAPLQTRIQKVTARYKVNTENAEWLIDKADSEMAGAVYLLYGRAWDDPREYDLCFDTSRNTPEEIVRIAKAAIAEREILYSEESQAIIFLRMRAAEVLAGIATDPTFNTFLLSVKPKEDGMPEYGLILRAVVSDQKDIKRLEDVAVELAGNLPIECEVRTRMQSRFPTR